MTGRPPGVEGPEGLHALVAPDAAELASGVFHALAYLYLPADRAVPSRTVEAPPSWHFDDAATDGVDSLVWGRMPIRSSARAWMSTGALRREVAQGRLRLGRRGRLRLRRIHRLAPVRRPGAIKMATRSLLMSGLIAELSVDDGQRRIVDAVTAVAGASNARATRLRPSGDGSALGWLRLDDGRQAVLRVARSGTLKDPRLGHRALEALAATELEVLPRPIASGETAGAAWCTETPLAGRITTTIHRGVLDGVVRAMAMMPRSVDPVTSIDERTEELVAVFPDMADGLRRAAEGFRQRAVDDDLGSVLVHGDLWVGNLLVEDRRLTGIVDWDTWHPSGLPGSDLFHMLAMFERSRYAWDFGALWRSRFWRWPRIREAMQPYWSLVDLRPSDAGLDAVAFDWWLGQATSALRRGRRPAADPQWVSQNVRGLVRDFGTVLAEGRRAPRAPAARAETGRPILVRSDTASP